MIFGKGGPSHLVLSEYVNQSGTHNFTNMNFFDVTHLFSIDDIVSCQQNLWAESQFKGNTESVALLLHPVLTVCKCVFRGTHLGNVIRV